MVDHLERLLRAAGVPRPFVFVGPSFGGAIVHLYAQRRPADVAGLVLVDPAHPDVWDFAARAFPDAEPNPENLDREASSRQMRNLRPLGAVPLIVLIAGNRVYPPGVRTDVLSNGYKLWTDRLRELASLSTSGKWMLVPDSSHYIQTDHPEIVVDTLHRVITDFHSRGHGLGTLNPVMSKR